jgi:hypothetical protein
MDFDTLLAKFNAGTATPAEVEELQRWQNRNNYQGGGDSPLMSAFSSGIQAAIQREQQGRQALGADIDLVQYGWDGYKSRTGLGFGEPSPDQMRAGVRDFLGKLQTAQLYAGEGTRNDNLVQMYDQYVDALNKGDGKTAALLNSRAKLSGAMFSTLVQDADRDAADNWARTLYDKDGKYVAKPNDFGSSALGFSLGDAFYNGGGGWSVAKSYADRFGLSAADVAYALGVDEQTADRNMYGTRRSNDAVLLAAPEPTPAPPPPAAPEPSREDMINLLSGASPATAPPAAPRVIVDPEPPANTGNNSGLINDAILPKGDAGSLVGTADFTAATSDPDLTLPKGTDAKVTGEGGFTDATNVQNLPLPDGKDAVLGDPPVVTDGKVTGNKPLWPSDYASLTDEQKATTYASLRRAGFTDADIRTAAGAVPEAQWQGLRRSAGYDLAPGGGVTPGSSNTVTLPTGTDAKATGTPGFTQTTIQPENQALTSPPPDQATVDAQVIVYGPDGTAYSSPAAARAAGVTNFTLTPPANAVAPTPRFSPRITAGQTTRVSNNNWGGLLASANDPMAAGLASFVNTPNRPGLINSAGNSFNANPFATPTTPQVQLPPGVVAPWLRTPGGG